MESCKFEFGTLKKFIKSVERIYRCKVGDSEVVSYGRITYSSFWEKNEKLVANVTRPHEIDFQDMIDEMEMTDEFFNGEQNSDEIMDFTILGQEIDEELLTNLTEICIELNIYVNLLDFFTKAMGVKAWKKKITLLFEYDFFAHARECGKLTNDPYFYEKMENKRSNMFSYQDIDIPLYLVSNGKNMDNEFELLSMKCGYIYVKQKYVKRMILLKNLVCPSAVKHDICDILGWLVDN